MVVRLAAFHAEPALYVERTKYMLLSLHRNVGQNGDIKTANRLFENISESTLLWMTLTNQNLIEEEIIQDGIVVMLASIRCRIFCILVCYQKTLKLEYTGL
jgi:hypothetical protein